MSTSVAHSASSSSASPASSSDPSTAPSGATKTLKSAAVFKAIASRINADTVSKVKASYRFDISPDEGGAAQSWLIDLKQGEGVVQSCGGGDKADCVIAMKDSDYVLLMTGKLNPQAAFMKGKLKLKGNIMLAQKLNALMPAKQPSKAKQPPGSGQQRDEKRDEAAGDRDGGSGIKSKL